MKQRLTIRLNLLPLFLLYVAALLVWALVAGCASAPSAADTARLAQTISAAVQDGVVTPLEVQGIQALLQSMQPPAIDWLGTIGTVAGSAVAALIGVKYLPTRVFQGPFDPKPPQA